LYWCQRKICPGIWVLRAKRSNLSTTRFNINILFFFYVLPFTNAFLGPLSLFLLAYLTWPVYNYLYIEHYYILKIIIIVFNINYIFIIIFKKVTHNLFVILNYNTIIFSFFLFLFIYIYILCNVTH
jgi:hypothetical protein